MCLPGLRDMATAPALPLPNRDMLVRLANATVTRISLDRDAKTLRGAVYDANGALVPASRRFPDVYRGCDPETLAEAMAGRHAERRLPRALYLGHAFTHFGHFLLETMSALSWAGVVDADMPLLFHPFDERSDADVFSQQPHGVACLQLLGIPRQRIVMATTDMAVEDLLVAPRAYRIGHGPSCDFRSVCHALREAALRDERQPATQRVYLSRRRLKRRLGQRLSNEMEVERQVARRGFAVLHPEQMSFADQIRAVAGADIVAGVDGSALHLSAFMRPRTRMLVLETQRRLNILHLNALMEVETIAVPALQSANDPRSRSIDPGQLDAALDQLGCPPASGAAERLIRRLFR
jgi:capsular polysaccharide biosynthesis protein